MNAMVMVMVMGNCCIARSGDMWLGPAAVVIGAGPVARVDRCFIVEIMGAWTCLLGFAMAGLAHRNIPPQ